MSRAASRIRLATGGALLALLVAAGCTSNTPQAEEPANDSTSNAPAPSGGNDGAG